MSNPNYTSPKVTNMLPKWQFMDDLEGGRDAIKAGGDKYLPMGDSETDNSYKNRLKHIKYTDLFNPTVKGINGLIFQKPITYEDLDPKLEDFIENSDATGNHFDLTLAKMMGDALKRGISYILVDIPPKGESNADVKVPFVTHIHPSNIINWKLEDGSLSQVTIREYVEEDIDEFQTEIVEQFRVIYRGYYELYRTSKLNKNNVDIVEMEETGIDYIPLYNLNLDDDNEFMITKPPLYNLGWSCIDLYQNESDSKNSFHIASVPMFSGVGVDPDDFKKLTISANTAVFTQNAEAKFGWIEFEAKALKFARDMALDIKSDIAKEGLNAISGQVQVTATESIIDNIKTQSKLFHWVRKLKDVGELILACVVDMQGANAQVPSIDIDISALKGKLDAQKLTLYSNMVANGQLSVESLWDIMLKDGELPESFDKDVEKQRIEEGGLLDNDEPRT